MNIVVFGLGSVGCLTAVGLARNGHRVVGVEQHPDCVRLINEGRSPVAVTGLDSLIRRAVESRRLRAVSTAGRALMGAHAALICAGTASAVRTRANAQAIEHVGREIGAALGPRTEPLTVVVRTIVLPGATERRLRPALRDGLNQELAGRVRVAVNPILFRDGPSVADLDAPSMILVGADDPAAAAFVRSLYVGVKAPFVHTSIRTAELVGFAASGGLEIARANELGDFANAYGVDRSEFLTIYGCTRPRRIA